MRWIVSKRGDLNLIMSRRRDEGVRILLKLLPSTLPFGERRLLAVMVLASMSSSLSGWLLGLLCPTAAGDVGGSIGSVGGLW